MTSYNKILTTVNSVTSNYTLIPDFSNVITIDTSYNRIGIGTLTPETSLHIKGSSNTGIITTNLEISSKLFKGKIYVSDFFFTTCPTICIAMTDNMVKVQEKIKNNPHVLLLSHSVTPKIDSVSQLKKYAIQKGVIDQKWHLVTGDKRVIYDLARKSYLAVKQDGDGGPFDMIHTENFILVDPDRRVRGFYDGTDSREIQRLLEELEILTQEYFPS